MAILIVIFSGITGLISALVALFGFDASWVQALVIYFVATTLPVALFMSAIYLHMLIKSEFDTSETAVEVQRIR